MMIQRPTARLITLVIFIIASAAYLVWRVIYTLNPDAPVYSWVFLSLETYAILCALAFYWVTLRRGDPTPRPAPEGARVDVVICTYNEPAALLRQTVRRALAMDYPHRTYLCDDGRRPEIEALAGELGCEYISRADNAHYKAGNLNNALKHIGGDFIVVLDADHLVQRDFLVRLLGYFDDPEVALVQTPQVFYNLDSFQHHFKAQKRQLWHEGAIFHHAMQPGANRWNAAFFVGTGAVVRRSAIEAIGGFATGSITEDAFTCMRLHAAGYKSIYCDEPLGYLVAPESLHQYLTQRLRWGQGSMQILRLENPLTRRGLSWRQRLVYVAALSSFAQAVVHLAYYLAPAIFLLGGPAPLRATEPIDFAPLIAHIVFDLAIFKLWLGPLSRPLLTECYKFLNVWVFIKALGAYFGRAGKLRFKVTTKGRDTGASLMLLAPQAALLLINGTAFGYGILRLASGEHSAIGVLGTLVATAFAGLFVIVGAMAFLFAWTRLAAESEYTFPDEIPATVPGARPIDALVLRANDAEMHVLLPEKTPVGDRMTLALELGPESEPISIAASVTESHPVAEGIVARLSIASLSAEQQDHLFDRFAEHAVPRLLGPIVSGWTGRSSTAPPDAYFLPVQTNVL